MLGFLTHSKLPTAKAGGLYSGATAEAASEEDGAVLSGTRSHSREPHFYQAGWIVVLYVGQDQAIIGALTTAIGPQVPGGRSGCLCLEWLPGLT